MQKSASAVFIFAAITFLSATPVRADSNYPWCAQYGGEGADLNCGFVSREQCMETVRGAGGSCVANVFYTGAAGGTSQSKRKRQN